MSKASLSFQDCDRRLPQQPFTVTFVDVKPSGIDLKFSKGREERTRVQNVYSVNLTPGAGKGSWKNMDVEGLIEGVKQYPQPSGTRIEGIWVEGGERSIMVVEIAPE